MGVLEHRRQRVWRRVPMAPFWHLVNLDCRKSLPRGSHTIVDKSIRREERKKRWMKKSDRNRTASKDLRFPEANCEKTVAKTWCNAIVWLCSFFVMIIRSTSPGCSSDNVKNGWSAQPRDAIWERCMKERERLREKFIRHTLRWIDFWQILRNSIWETYSCGSITRRYSGVYEMVQKCWMRIVCRLIINAHSELSLRRQFTNTIVHSTSLSCDTSHSFLFPSNFLQKVQTLIHRATISSARKNLMSRRTIYK